MTITHQPLFVNHQPYMCPSMSSKNSRKETSVGENGNTGGFEPFAPKRDNGMPPPLCHDTTGTTHHVMSEVVGDTR